MMGLDYASPTAREAATGIMRVVCHSAYRASTGLAREKGAFPFYERDPYLARPFIGALPEELRDSIARSGIRNSHLTAIAPAGTISLLANAVSNGIEPIYGARYRRAVLDRNGERVEFDVEDDACRRWRERHGDGELPPGFVDAEHVAPEAHLEMQAAAQPYVDGAISKTVNVPESLDFESFRSLYERAHALGLKGVTAFRPNPITGAVLTSTTAAELASHCCSIEREAD